MRRIQYQPQTLATLSGPQGTTPKSKLTQNYFLFFTPVQTFATTETFQGMLGVDVALPAGTLQI